MSKTKQSVAIVGANGQVGTELSVLLRDSGLTVYPIVRNQLGATFFDHHEFDHRIGDVTKESDAEALLKDTDAVVIAAFAPWFGGPKPREARRINEAIVQNSIEYAPDDATIIYFSSLVAYGSDIGLSDWHWYGRTKRHLESIVRKKSEQESRQWYSLRLGHVYGPNQDHTQEFVNSLRDREHVYLPVEGDQDTNIVHTVTLADSINRCIRGAIESGMYGVVNNPQWNWKEIAEYYLPETEVIFKPELRNQKNKRKHPTVSSFVAKLLSSLETRREILMTFLLYLPDRVSTYLDHTTSSADATNAIERYTDRQVYQHRHFGYGSVPGPFIEVQTTKERVNEKTAIVRNTLGLPSR